MFAETVIDFWNVTAGTGGTVTHVNVRIRRNSEGKFVG